MFVNKHVLDVIVVVVISSVCYIDHLLCHDFLGSNSSGFSAQKKRRKLASKGKVKCGRRARPNGLASRVKHHLVKEKKRIDFANIGFNTFSYHKKGIIEVQTLQSRPKKEETKKRHKGKKKLIFGIYQIWPLVKQRAARQTPLTRRRNSLKQKKTT